MSHLEEILEQHIKLFGLSAPAREFRFHPKRRWRFDFAWPLYKVAVEVDGGTYIGGRHNRGEGFKKDCEKRNAAVLEEWKVLHFTTGHLTDKEIQKTVQQIDELIRKSVTWRSRR